MAANGPHCHSLFTLLGFVKVKLFAMGQLLPSVKRLQLRVIKVGLDLGLPEFLSMNANTLWPKGMEAGEPAQNQYGGRGTSTEPA